VLDEERETEREEAAELEVGDTLPVPGEQVDTLFTDHSIIFLMLFPVWRIRDVYPGS
jgi:hypothetical protein